MQLVVCLRKNVAMMDLQTFLAEWQNDTQTISVHSSGSTGVPKIFHVAKQRMLASAKQTCDFLGLKAGDAALLCMSLDHIGGKMMVVRTIERDMRLLSVCPSGNPLSDQSLSALPEPNVEITFAAMVPLQVYNTLQHPKETERLKQIKQLIIGGGAVDERLLTILKDFPNPVWSTYGMTETLSHIALRRLNGAQASTYYEALPNVALSLNDEGCLVIDAPNVCSSQLTTNDLAHLRIEHDAEGRKKYLFQILGRKDNVINSGGVKIQIEAVENLLQPHLAEPFAICKRRSEKYGEEVVLVTESVALETIKKLCETLLPKYWQPKHYQHFEQIPLTPTGKIARAEIARILQTMQE